MKNSNTLSIIVPIFGVEKYINNFLDSLTPQLSTDVEIIFVDDGSKDRSVEIIKDYLTNNADKNLTLYSQENKGVSAARNKGIELATGDYVTFIDPDDEVTEGYITKILDTIENYNDVDIIHFNATIRNINGAQKLLKLVESNGLKIVDKNYRQKLFKKNHWQICLRVFSKETLKDHTFPVGMIFEDMYTLPFLYKDDIKVFEIDLPLYVYKLRASSLTRVINTNYVDSLKRCLNLFREVRSDNDFYLIYEHCFHLLNAIMLKSDYAVYNEFFQQNKPDFEFVYHNRKLFNFRFFINFYYPKHYFYYKNRNK